MKIITDIAKQRLEVFSSLGEMVDYASTQIGIGKTSDRQDDDRTKWAGSASLQDAIQHAHRGYNEIRPKVESIMDIMEERLAERFGDRYVTEYAVTGGAIDMGKFVTGEPECMLEWRSEPAASMGRVVKVVVAGTVSASVDKELIIKRGVAVCALLDTLHKLGVGVELWWDSTVNGEDSKRHTTAVKLHDSSEPLDIDNIMWAVAHPSMLRRVVFAVQEKSKTYKAQGAVPYGGFGTPANLGLTAVDDFDVKVERLQSGHDPMVTDPLQWVINAVEGLGFTE